MSTIFIIVNYKIIYTLKVRNLNEYISESIFDIDDETITNKSAYKYYPKDRHELEQCIMMEFHEQQREDVVNLNCISVSEIWDMRALFPRVFRSDVHRKFDVSAWDVSNVEMMDSMFKNCVNFDCDLSTWEMPKCKSMNNMFENCSNFNQDVSNWDISKVHSMNGMFKHCTSFEGRGLHTWKFKSVFAKEMFYNCVALNTSIPNWTVDNCDSMFFNCYSMQGQLMNWKIKSVTLTRMFDGCSNFKGAGLETWDTPYPLFGLDTAFRDCPNIDIDISKWKINYDKPHQSVLKGVTHIDADFIEKNFPDEDEKY